MKLLANPLPRREDLEPPACFSIAEDRFQQTATLDYAVSYGAPWPHRARYTVSARDPARAVADAESARTIICRGKPIVTRARCVTESDSRAFHHTTEIAITVDGMPHWQKRWRTTVPRGTV